jgi:hypothetical protein
MVAMDVVVEVVVMVMVEVMATAQRGAGGVTSEPTRTRIAGERTLGGGPCREETALE